MPKGRPRKVSVYGEKYSCDNYGKRDQVLQDWQQEIIIQSNYIKVIKYSLDIHNKEILRLTNLFKVNYSYEIMKRIQDHLSSSHLLEKNLKKYEELISYLQDKINKRIFENQELLVIA